MISVGPLALALERLFAVLGIVAFMAAASWIGRRHGKDSDKAAWRALLVGLVAARAGFVGQNWSAFAVEPLSIFYVWQGGFFPLAGLAAAAISLVLSLRRSPALFPTGMAFVGSAAAALIATSLFLASSQRPLPQGLVLHSLAGEASALDDRKGKPFVINLWASWCPPCRREMPMLIEEAARSPVPILLANQGEDATKVRTWLDGQRLTSAHILLDSDQSAAAAIGSAGLPATLFVDSKGVIRELHVGEISRAALLAGLRELD
ncbi:MULTISPECIES: TlpA disulfide reductase family protein [Sphingomonadales]|jgi:thiol-disulfide isomerase/thioredoxin|uniref:Redoxin domain protein n=3 Tax=Sphingomonadaceae TaxID=41297 RepID=A0A9J9HE34_RHIWR|nr:MULTISPECIES: TlpA disulfide reductase family protein [Sphingomonadaceae]ABQ70078.1 Redoxin domain protein [Rhizorhabdus wittichii RW1]ARR52955.1 redoxin [Rhizorhabdus wittichii DC-6]PJG48443.1 redoxin [Sphingobium sp. LB126]QTH24356.1 TlpA family protein disulfide reductase [Rhizorhabdus wittichii]QUM73103.1 TlpA family protein disulfide reductase [Sphingopyxis granuli]